MAGRVQMDVTGDDVNYFVERGFSRKTDDLNCFEKVVVHGSHLGGVEERLMVLGRSHGWRWYRNIWSCSRHQMIRQHIGELCMNTPIACFVSAEVNQWGRGSIDGNTTE